MVPGKSPRSFSPGLSRPFLRFKIDNYFGDCVKPGRILITACLLLLVQSVSAQPDPVFYFMPHESYTINCCQISDATGPARVDIDGGVFISHEVTIYVFERHVDAVNITVPYPLENESESSECFRVITTSNRDMVFATHPTGNQTVLAVSLPETIYAGDDLRFSIEYSAEGMVKPGQLTFWDRVLGREENWELRFTPPSQDTTTNELDLEISIPYGYVPKRWSPPQGKRSVETPFSVRWWAEDAENRPLEYSLVFGKTGLGKAASTILIFGGIVGFLAIFLAALYIKSRYGHSPMQDSEVGHD